MLNYMRVVYNNWLWLREQNSWHVVSLPEITHYIHLFSIHPSRLHSVFTSFWLLAVHQLANSQTLGGNRVKYLGLWHPHVSSEFRSTSWLQVGSVLTILGIWGWSKWGIWVSVCLCFSASQIKHTHKKHVFEKVK